MKKLILILSLSLGLSLGFANEIKEANPKVCNQLVKDLKQIDLEYREFRNQDNFEEMDRLRQITHTKLGEFVDFRCYEMNYYEN